MRELDNIGAAADEQQVGRNGGLGIPMHLADYSLYINVKIPSVNITTYLVMLIRLNLVSFSIMITLYRTRLNRDIEQNFVSVRTRCHTTVRPNVTGVNNVNKL